MERVLLIEDEEKSRMLMTRVINKEGFETIPAKDGKEGLDIFAKERPHIVVTDLKMPKIDGLEVLHTIKRLSPLTEVILLTAHGGYDAAISAVREGASDYLRKPIDLNELAAALMRSRERLVVAKEITATATVLLVEDDATARAKLARVLEKEDWKVFSASDGKEALAIFNEHKIDILIADLKMPNMDGMTLLREVRQRTADCEILVITGYGDESTAIAAMREGAINYIKKPIDLDQLILGVEKALEKLHLRRSMLYRAREADLAREVIVKISRDNKVVIDVRDAGRRPTREYAQKLLESLPVGLLVLTRDGNVSYANPHLVQHLGFEPEAINDALIQGLVKIGLDEIKLKEFIASIERLFEEDSTEGRKISMGEHAYTYATRISIIGETKTDEAVLLLVRGARGKR